VVECFTRRGTVAEIADLYALMACTVLRSGKPRDRLRVSAFSWSSTFLWTTREYGTKSAVFMIVVEYVTHKGRDCSEEFAMRRLGPVSCVGLLIVSGLASSPAPGLEPAGIVYEGEAISSPESGINGRINGVTVCSMD